MLKSSSSGRSTDVTVAKTNTDYSRYFALSTYKAKGVNVHKTNLGKRMPFISQALLICIFEQESLFQGAS